MCPPENEEQVVVTTKAPTFAEALSSGAMTFLTSPKGKANIAKIFTGKDGSPGEVSRIFKDMPFDKAVRDSAYNETITAAGRGELEQHLIKIAQSVSTYISENYKTLLSDDAIAICEQHEKSYLDYLLQAAVTAYMEIVIENAPQPIKICSILRDSLPDEDVSKIDLGNFTQGYIRVRNKGQGLDDMFYIDKNNKTRFKIEEPADPNHPLAEQLEKLDKEVTISAEPTVLTTGQLSTITNRTGHSVHDAKIEFNNKISNPSNIIVGKLTMDSLFVAQSSSTIFSKIKAYILSFNPFAEKEITPQSLDAKSNAMISILYKSKEFITERSTNPENTDGDKMALKKTLKVIDRSIESLEKGIFQREIWCESEIKFDETHKQEGIKILDDVANELILAIEENLMPLDTKSGNKENSILSKILSFFSQPKDPASQITKILQSDSHLKGKILAHKGALTAMKLAAPQSANITANPPMSSAPNTPTDTPCAVSRK